MLLTLKAGSHHLSDRFQLVYDASSSYRRDSHGGPQGSELGPVLFTLYMLPLQNIILWNRINFADKTQLYLLIKAEETGALGHPSKRSWQTSNFQLCRLDKTEVILFCSEPLRISVTNHLITLDGSFLASSLCVKNSRVRIYYLSFHFNI